MALFKIFKGSKDNLNTSTNTANTHEGYAYFTPDDGKFYIDTKDNETPNIGIYSTTSNGVNRVCINETIFNTTDTIILDCGNSE